MSYPKTIFASSGNLYQCVTNEVTAKYSLGQKMEYEDGRVFRYVKAGGTLLQVGDILEGKSVVSGDYTNLAVDAVTAVGDLTVTFTSATTTAAAYYNGGWMHNNKNATSAKAGEVYRIKSSPLLTSGAGDIITLEDLDPIRVALAVLDEIGLTPNPYNGVVEAATTPVSMPVGVGVKAITAAYHGWVQTGGMCAIASATSSVIGENFAAVMAAAGRGAVGADYVSPDIGVTLSVPDANDEMCLVYLTMD